MLPIHFNDRPLWTFFLLSLLLHAVLLRVSIQPSVVPPTPVLEVRIDTPVKLIQPSVPAPAPTQAKPTSRKPEPPAPTPIKPLATEALPGTAPTVPVPTPSVSAPTPVPRAEKPNAEGKSGVIFDAAYLRNPPPDYPPQSRTLEEEGVVKLKVRVSAEGRALTVEMAKSSGFKRLDAAALEAVRQWRFVPAKQDGLAVEDTVIVPLRFTLNE